MEVKLTNIKGTWEEVANRARTTVSKGELGKEPSEKFKRRITMAEHSPIRGRIYCFKITGLKSWVATHLVRHHVGVEKWVSTQREDRTDNKTPRDELPQGALVNMEIEANAQALINISRKRLCTQASPETRAVWQEVKNQVQKADPVIADVMVKECVYRGFCPEMICCGYVNTEAYQKELKAYRDTISRENKEV